MAAVNFAQICAKRGQQAQQQPCPLGPSQARLARQSCVPELTWASTTMHSWRRRSSLASRLVPCRGSRLLSPARKAAMCSWAMGARSCNRGHAAGEQGDCTLRPGVCSVRAGYCCLPGRLMCSSAMGARSCSCGHAAGKPHTQVGSRRCQADHCRLPGRLVKAPGRGVPVPAAEDRQQVNKETTCLGGECALSGQAPIACCDCVTGLILEQVSCMLNTCRGSALQRKHLAPGESLLHPLIKSCSWSS